MRSFPNRQDAQSYADRHPAPSIRFVGRCAVCGAGGAQSVPGRWSVGPDLFGVYEVDAVAAGWPSGDPCGHDSVRWERVLLVAGVFDDCSDTCRDALGASCACSCLGRQHGARHRIKPNHGAPDMHQV